MVEPTLVFVNIMEKTVPGMPFSEEVNKACADFMHHESEFLSSSTEIRDSNVFAALTHAANPRFPYVVPSMHALSKCGYLIGLSKDRTAQTVVPFSTAWFFAFSQTDKDKLIDAYVTLMDIFDTNVLLPTEKDKELFVKALVGFCQEMNKAIKTLEAQIFEYIPEHTHFTVDKTGKHVQSVLVDSVGSAVKEEKQKGDKEKEKPRDHAEDITKAAQLPTAPRALCHVVKSLRGWLSRFETVVPPHVHMWSDGKQEFASKQLIKEIRVSSVIPPATEPEVNLVPIFKMRQEIKEWPSRIYSRPIPDHTHYILSGDTKKDVIVVGIGSNIAIGEIKK